MPMSCTSSPAFARSDSIASSTPGYCTFTATARPSFVIARWTWPIDAAANGIGSHVVEELLGAIAELSATTCAASSEAIDGAFGLELRELLAHRLGQALVEVARHLADLHQCALHVAERVGDLFRGPQLVLGVELLRGVPADANTRRARCSRVRAPGFGAERAPPRRCARARDRVRTGDGELSSCARFTAMYVAAAAPNAPTAAAIQVSARRHGSGP